MAIKAEPFSSKVPVSPGSILKDEIEYLGITQKELANRMGRPTQAINEIINGKKAVTPETALELESVLGIKAHIWTNLEAGYRLALARSKLDSRKNHKSRRKGTTGKPTQFEYGDAPQPTPQIG